MLSVHIPSLGIGPNPLTPCQSCADRYRTGSGSDHEFACAVQSPWWGDTEGPNTSLLHLHRRMHSEMIEMFVRSDHTCRKRPPFDLTLWRHEDILVDAAGNVVPVWIVLLDKRSGRPLAAMVTSDRAAAESRYWDEALAIATRCGCAPTTLARS